ncbi:hypothetical protein J2W97_000782 [Paenibacillus jamilae]|uniref:Uncharacterized protein n=1 Tax=Paenibacillus polymyxa TaxID=1406 RepID=A0A378Y2T6_PAEPO|nr:hypothetical protein PPSQR21_030000 [Paenibacillus polymyxa SQR-21]MDP9674799.1 hypothetical protein [Paenibacillus jamilae]SEJ74045.1 hypothetical protein SAMN04488600_104179 [Paenibacillus polymyxa]SPY16384.1 Uncharacterised protein [Paenibacillus polymyxa]SUA70627.1 Uncharacterised protein [Paenibacillus polymyxa]
MNPVIRVLQNTAVAYLRPTVLEDAFTGFFVEIG